MEASCGSVSEWVLSWFNGSNSDISERLLFTCMIGAWIIWKDMCEKIFQGVNLNSISMANRIQYHLSAHLHENLICGPYNTYNAKSNWLPPAQGIAKFNVDTSFNCDTNQNGIGVVLRDHAGNCDGIKENFKHGVLNPEQGECLAVRDALLWAKEMNLDDMQVESDAQVVIKTVTEDPWIAHWKNINLVREIKHLSFLFNSCNYTFVPRDDNQVANSMAKRIRVSATHLIKFDNFGNELCDLLAQDQNSHSD